MHFFTMTDKPRTTADLYALLDARRMELGLSQLQLGQLAFGRPDSSSIQSLKRGSSPTFDRLSQLCDALGFELYCGPPRKASAAGLREDPPTDSDLDKPTALRAGYLPLPWHRLARASGASPLAFQPEWFAGIGHVPDRLSVVAPDVCHIPHGMPLATMLAVVDDAARRSSSPQVWAFLERGRTVIARIQSMHEALMIHDSDPAIGSRLLMGKEREATAMIGRVIWLGQPVAGETLGREVMS